MKLILFLAAIYALIFYQSYKIQKTKNPPDALETSALKKEIHSQEPIMEEGKNNNGFSFGSYSHNKSSLAIQ